MQTIETFTGTLIKAEDLSPANVSVTPQHVSWTDRDVDDYTWTEGYRAELADTTVQMLAVDGAAYYILPGTGYAYERDEYDEYVEHLDSEGDETAPGLSEDQWREAFDSESNVPDGPTISYFYPAHFGMSAVNAAALIADLPLTVVNLDGTEGLALSGGGQDMSWFIVEAFVRLGQVPPAHFADLSHEAGRKMTERNIAIVHACLRSFEVQRDRAEWNRGLLAERLDSWIADSNARTV